MAKDSKMVRRRVEAVEHLRSAVAVHGSSAAEGLEARMAAVLEEGERMPDVAHLIDVLSRMLEHECRALDGDDDERWNKTLSVQMLREERRASAAELRGKLIELRDSLRGIYGAEKASLILDLKGRTPRGFEALALYARRLVRRLRSIELPATRVELKVDPRAWADDLEPPSKRLMALVRHLRAGGWREEDAVRARNSSLSSFDADYVPVTRLIECIYLLGDQPDLAKKLRPRRGRRLVNRHATFDLQPKPTPLSEVALMPRLPGILGRLARWLCQIPGKHPPRHR